jgi:DNA-binding CsgD family transcriptional regulator
VTWPPLTPRENEALTAYGELWSYTAVAHRMRLSENTVRRHLANARSKLGARKTAEALVIRARGQSF